MGGRGGLISGIIYSLANGWPYIGRGGGFKLGYKSGILRYLVQFVSLQVLVVGNPANTNCMIAQKMAPSIPAANFTCLTRLDQNRAKGQVHVLY